MGLKEREVAGAGENRIMNNLVTFQHTRVIRSVQHFMVYTLATHGMYRICRKIRREETTLKEPAEDCECLGHCTLV